MGAKSSVRSSLTAATCALLGLNAPARVEAFDLETAVLVYTESLGQLNAYESTTRLRSSLGGEKRLAAGLVVDILTGASPNGATPSTQPQTFTRPSGKGWYTIDPGETPLDNTFQDNRVAIDAEIELPLGRMMTFSVGGHGSVEYDYVSIGANGSIARDFNKRNTRIRAGVAVSQDYLDPEGGPPIPFAPMLPPGVPPNRQADSKDKITIDGVVGMDQILSRRAVARLNYSVSAADGYLTDAFKMLSRVSDAPGPFQGEPVEYVYENRPESRVKQSVYGEMRLHLTRNVLDMSYRYMWDDWEITSHTAELRYAWELSGRTTLEPQLRYYHQTAAGFYRHSLIYGDPFPDFASADYRLGEFNAVTVALRYSTLVAGNTVNLRIGYYVQMGDRSPPDAIGVQRSLDLFPTVRALTFQVAYGLSI
jgi:hypothetical protein